MVGYSPRATQTPVSYAKHVSIYSQLRKAKYLFRNFIHVEPNKVVTVGVVQDRETPRVLEGHQVGFTGVKVKMQDFKQSNLLLSDLRTVNDFA